MKYFSQITEEFNEVQFYAINTYKRLYNCQFFSITFEKQWNLLH